MSPKSTSLMSPRDTKWENPMFRAAAQSSTAVITAPDWATNARSPGFGWMCAKLAFKPTRGAMIPRQLGPTIRKMCGRAASSIAWRSSPPASSPPSPNPAVITTAPLVPRAAQGRNQPRNRRGRGGDDREIRHHRQRVDIRVGQHPLDGRVPGIDRHDRSIEAGVEQIAGQYGAHRRGFLAGADQRDGSRLEDKVQVPDAHRCCFRLAKFRSMSL